MPDIILVASYAESLQRFKHLWINACTASVAGSQRRAHLFVPLCHLLKTSYHYISVASIGTMMIPDIIYRGYFVERILVTRSDLHR